MQANKQKHLQDELNNLIYSKIQHEIQEKNKFQELQNQITLFGRQID